MRRRPSRSAPAEELRRNWEQLGETDPFWAILADPSKRGNRWDVDDFFRTGTIEVAGYLAHLERTGVDHPAGRALDFGCGAGRLSLALAQHFDRVDGVDIAASMVDLARTHAGAAAGVRYHHHTQPDLTLFDDAAFDLVLSIVVLQHMRNDLKQRYLAEFMRVLAPGGVAVFTVPSSSRPTPAGMVHRFVPNRVLNVYRRRRYGTAGVMELHPMRREAVEDVVRAAGGEVVSRTREPMAGAPWVSYLYVVRRAGEHGGPGVS